MLRRFTVAFGLSTLTVPAAAWAQDATVEQAAGELKSAYEHGGWLALVGVGIGLVVRLYRAVWVQALLHPTARWDAWPRWAKTLAIAVVAAGPALGTALGTGLGWAAALGGAITSALAAIGVNEVGVTAAKPAAKKAPA